MAKLKVFTNNEIDLFDYFVTPNLIFLISRKSYKILTVSKNVQTIEQIFRTH